ncbi:MAG: hypothetical protein NTZ33_09100 [Bacteroidetes bacterium]|nr:hypothetical protein [Bacteroidota bacterium]
MNSKKIIIVSVAVILTVLGVFLVLFTLQFTPKYKWYEKYDIKSKEPYGIKYFYTMLKKSVADEDFVTLNKSLLKQLPQDAKGTNYFFIGSNILEDSVEMEHLLKYVENGNKAFIFTKYMPWKLIKKLTDKEVEYDSKEDSSVNILFPDNSLQLNFKHRFNKKNSTYEWNYLNGMFFKNVLQEFNGFTPLSYIDSNHVNYYAAKYGKGNLYFNTTPILFTNYYIITDNGYTYTNKCLSHFNKGKIYWDAYSKLAFFGDDYNMPDSSPLRYIISQKSFSWAWFTGIVMVLLFVIFHSKREQRIIPIINPTKNTSLEFNKAISVLYFQAKDNRIIAEEIMKMFLLFIKNKYSININIDKYNDFIPQLANRSEINEDKIKGIFREYIGINFDNITDKTNLVNFHTSIEYFYKNCK